MPSHALQPELVGPPSAKTRALILMAFVIVYALACGLPALRLEGQKHEWYGVELMVIGPLAIQHGHYSWLANLGALGALLCVMRGHVLATVILSGIALGLGLQTFWLPGTTIPLSNDPADKVRVLSVAPGCFVWLVALLQPLTAAFLLRHTRTKPRPELAE